MKKKFKRNKDEDEELEDIEYDEDDDFLAEELEEVADDLTGDVDISKLEPDITLSDLGADISFAESTGTLTTDNQLDDLNIDDLTEELDTTGDLDTSDIEQELEVEFEEEIEDLDELEEEEFEQEESVLKKLINQHLPFLGKLINRINLKKESTSRVDDADANSGQSLQEKIKSRLNHIPGLEGIMSKISKRQDLKNEDEEFDPNAISPITYATDEDEKPKRKLKVIHLFIIGALFLIMFYDDIVPPEAPPAPAPTQPVKPWKKKTNKLEEITKPKEAEAKKDAPLENNKDATKLPLKTSDKTAEQIKEVGTTTKDELISDTDIPVKETTPVVPPKNDEVKAKEGPSVKADEDLDDLFGESKPVELEATSDTSDSQTVEQPVVSLGIQNETGDMSDENTNVNTSSQMDMNELTGQQDSESVDQLSDDQLEDDVVKGIVDQDITKSILEDLEVKIQADKKQEKIQRSVLPVEAPTYEMMGRGLVYNCVGKHWACIDSISFETCRKNYAWNTDQGKGIDCYPVKLYSAEEECELTQQKNIDEVADTNFCNF